MALRFSTALQNRMADDWGTVFNSGTIKIYTGAQPADGNTAASGTLLATITLPATAFAAAASGTAAKAGTWSGSVTTGGTAGWFRMADSGGTRVMDGTVGTSGTDMTLDNVVLVSGGTVTVNTFTITQAAS